MDTNNQSACSIFGLWHDFLKHCFPEFVVPVPLDKANTRGLWDKIEEFFLCISQFYLCLSPIVQVLFPGGGAFVHPGATPREFDTRGFETVKSPGRQGAYFIPSRWRLSWEKIWMSCNVACPRRVREQMLPKNVPWDLPTCIDVKRRT